MATSVPATKKTAKTAPSKSAEPKTAVKRTRKTTFWIRNLTTAHVHLRLFSQSPKDPYRIELQPRGQYGDTTSVPVSLQEDPTLIKGIGYSIEVITAAEAAAVQLDAGPVGYLGRVDAPEIIRPDDTTVMSAPDWDGKGRLPQDREVKRTPTGKQSSEREFGTGMHTTDIPGSDVALHATLAAEAKAGQSAMPDEAVFDRRVVIERVKGERNL